MLNAECRMRKAECRRRRPSSFFILPSSFSRAFTLLELLTVIAIMGIIAAIALPTMNSLKPNVAAAASRQLLDAVTHARQLALSQRTTVYMVFVPPGFWTDSATGSWTPNDWAVAANLYDKQMVGYTYVTLRSIGDQPGVSYPQYLAPWRTLPQGAYIATNKFISAAVLNIYTNGVLVHQVYRFNTTTNIPFPAETNHPPYVWLPYIAFDGMGQLVSGSAARPEVIPITQGNVGILRDPTTKAALKAAPKPGEVPPGNTINNFNLVYVDQLTGRARIERTKVQ